MLVLCCCITFRIYAASYKCALYTCWRHLAKTPVEDTCRSLFQTNIPEFTYRNSRKDLLFLSRIRTGYLSTTITMSQ